MNENWIFFSNFSSFFLQLKINLCLLTITKCWTDSKSIPYMFQLFSLTLEKEESLEIFYLFPFLECVSKMYALLFVTSTKDLILRKTRKVSKWFATFPTRFFSQWSNKKFLRNFNCLQFLSQFSTLSLSNILKFWSIKII